ncbi:MAG: hypothetical protein KKA64_02500 [Nanoarchaeota archaeon]|nr:hypothetical protein [Nanoarchaeota archaeon]
MKIQKLKIMENRQFSKSFKTKSFEDFVLQKQEVLEETGNLFKIRNFQAFIFQGRVNKK